MNTGSPNTQNVNICTYETILYVQMKTQHMKNFHLQRQFKIIGTDKNNNRIHMKLKTSVRAKIFFCMYKHCVFPTYEIQAPVQTKLNCLYRRIFSWLWTYEKSLSPQTFKFILKDNQKTYEIQTPVQTKLNCLYRRIFSWLWTYETSLSPQTFKFILKDNQQNNSTQKTVCPHGQ